MDNLVEKLDDLILRVQADPHLDKFFRIRIMADLREIKKSCAKLEGLARGNGLCTLTHEGDFCPHD